MFRSQRSANIRKRLASRTSVCYNPAMAPITPRATRTAERGSILIVACVERDCPQYATPYKITLEGIPGTPLVKMPDVRCSGCGAEPARLATLPPAPEEPF